MFEIFIALFGCIYIAVRCFSDACAGWDYDRRTAKEKEIRSRIQASPELDSKIRYPMFAKTTLDDLLETVHDEMVYILGEDYKEILLSAATCPDIFVNPWGILYNIALAKEGKISNGFKYHSSKKYKDITFKALQLIEKYVIDKNPWLDAKIVLYPHKDYMPHKKVEYDYTLGQAYFTWDFDVIDISNTRRMW